MLDPQQLRTFQEIARVGSYTRAAERLGFTQPAVSYQMRLLERAVGSQLFVKTGRQLRLTPAGTALVRHADQILTAIRVAERDLAHIAGTGGGPIRLVGFSSACATLIPRAVGRLRDTHPAIDVRMLHGEPEAATTAVMRGEADLGLTFRYATPEAADVAHPAKAPLARIPLLSDDVRLVMARRHALAETQLAGLWPLANETWLVSGERFADLIRRACARAGFAARIVQVADDYVATQSLVAEGVGIALLPQLSLDAFTNRAVVDQPVAGFPSRTIEVELWPDMLRVPQAAALLSALEQAASGYRATAPAAAGVERATVLATRRDGPDQIADWAEGFRLPKRSLPRAARLRPERSVFVSNETGVLQVHTWDRHCDAVRVLTNRADGTVLCDVSADGETVWWFADDNGSEFGLWMAQPYTGGPAKRAVADVKPGFPGGLALGLRCDALARSDSNGAEVFLVPHGKPARLVYSHPQFAAVGALSADDSLLAISHSEHGDAQKPAIRVFRSTSSADVAVADLWDGPGFGVWPIAFSPIAGSPELLVIHERHGRSLPMVWNPVTGEHRDIPLDLAGETSASWYPSGSALLIRHDVRGRSELYRAELSSAAITLLPTPRGHIGAAVAIDDETVEYEWSSACQPPRLMRSGKEAIAFRPADPVFVPEPLDEVVVAGSSGDIHALIARPTDTSPSPQPTVFLVHGGPAYHDSDSFSPVRNAWVASGYTVVQVNYRGSTGYGTEWRNANIGRPGRAELEDIIAVRDALVAAGTIDPQRLIIGGFSWGGYLALLAVSLYPDMWAIGIGMVPVADTAAVYDDMMEEIRAAYRVRFGGSPAEVPEVYRESSPLHVAAEVRAPVLITGGLKDPRCPIRQIELYVSRLEELGKQFEFHRFDWGHHPREIAGSIHEVELMLDFTRRFGC